MGRGRTASRASWARAGKVAWLLKAGCKGRRPLSREGLSNLVPSACIFIIIIITIMISSLRCHIPSLSLLVSNPPSTASSRRHTGGKPSHSAPTRSAAGALTLFLRRASLLDVTSASAYQEVNCPPGASPNWTVRNKKNVRRTGTADRCRGVVVETETRVQLQPGAQSLNETIPSRAKIPLP